MAESKGLMVLLALLVALIGGTWAAENVITASGPTFNDVLEKHPFVVAEFYAPWCGHCKKLAPEYEKAAGILKKNDPPVALVKIDATQEENKELASRYGIKGFPTLKVFRNGKADGPEDYKGPRDSAGIVSYLQRRAGPPSQHLASAEAVAEHRKKDPAVIGIFSGEGPQLESYIAAADSLRDDASFGHVLDPSLVEGAPPAPTALVAKSFDEPESYFGGSWEDAGGLRGWLERALAPLLPEMDQEPRNRKVLQKLFKDPNAVMVVGFSPKSNPRLDDFKAALREAANSSDVGSFLFAESGANAGALQYFGLAEADLPAFVINDVKNARKFVARQASGEDLRAWLEEYMAGKLEPFLKSEEPPADDKGPVKTVTARTFNNIVFGGKDVLLEFYAPWCGHCKKLAPVYEKVAKTFANNDTVVIAKLDATANDVPSPKFEVKGFPTLFFVSGASGEVVPYSGDRSERSLVDFVNSSARRWQGQKPEQDGPADMNRDEL